jgi:hypothetical protein
MDHILPEEILKGEILGYMVFKKKHLGNWFFSNEA